MTSIFEIFKIGVGPSSSHTMGPMVAAYRFGQRAADEIRRRAAVSSTPWPTYRVVVRLYGSLALTGVGHATDCAILAGLSGCQPATSSTEEIANSVASVRDRKELRLSGRSLQFPSHDSADGTIAFDESTDLLWLRNETMPEHPNAVRFQLYQNQDHVPVLEEDFFSTGGGFVYSRLELIEMIHARSAGVANGTDRTPYPFASAAELLAQCKSSGLSIAELIEANELIWNTAEEISAKLDTIWDVMQACIDRGCQTSGILPGSLRVPRRAPQIFRQLTQRLSCAPGAGDRAMSPSSLWQCRSLPHEFSDPLQQLDWVSLFALAVNEENAAGGKVVTAPTNGAAGVIPAVLAYYLYFVPGADREGLHQFLKTAAAIGILYKRNASFSAAEMGCQGEVGVACSMAAGGLAACLGGTMEQIENAAEIGMEHNLGLTCDPIAGLVQIPCIERNTMGATKAINAARLAVLYGDGKHFVSLDKVIETMRQTGVDMQAKYKETSLGGLAVNVVDC
jgi:L-serine dehydratase